MFFKLSLRNIRKSLRDYAIYFFTLITGVSVFYVFNAIGDQTAMLQISSSDISIISTLEALISGTGVFVAGVLGLLIVYANRFLMKRRNKEFALYMLMGMSKRRISAIILAETVIIGIGSLFAGLMTGIGLSQLMSAVVASLFEADMSLYRFTVSWEAIKKTVIYFTVMYLVAMLLGGSAVTKMKLIDLLQSEKRSENIRLKSPAVCFIVFLLSSAALGYAYYNAGWLFGKLNREKLLFIIFIGAASTYCIFWSLSGMLLRIATVSKKLYYKAVNVFTFRQISSRINTMVLSMTVICLMLFVTICTLMSAFSIRSSAGASFKKICPADIDIEFIAAENGGSPSMRFEDITEIYERNGCDIYSGFREAVHFHTYTDAGITYDGFLGKSIEDMDAGYRLKIPCPQIELVRISDYNELMRMYGKEQLELDDDEYILLCNFASLADRYNERIKELGIIRVFDSELRPRYDSCTEGFISLSSMKINIGLLVVPDKAVKESGAFADYFIGNLSADSLKDKETAEKRIKEQLEDILRAEGDNTAFDPVFISGRTIRSDNLGVSAATTFLGSYIGLVFLLACGAILSLKELAESTDSAGRYDTLRKIGADEKDISRSLFIQTGIFFLLPLLLAVLHSVFGMRFALQAIETLWIDDVFVPALCTFVIILLIYGGYFAVTYFCSRSIIKEKR